MLDVALPTQKNEALEWICFEVEFMPALHNSLRRRRQFEFSEEIAEADDAVLQALGTSEADESERPRGPRWQRRFKKPRRAKYDEFSSDCPRHHLAGREAQLIYDREGGC